MEPLERPHERLIWGTRGTLALVALAAVLALGLVRLFALRFEAGDVYPAYSSQRADPLGTKGLYDSLAGTGLDVRRNYRPAKRLAAEPGSAVLYLGLRAEAIVQMPAEEAEALEATAARGSRLVFSFLPEDSGSASKSEEPEAEVTEEDDNGGGDADPYAAEGVQPVRLTDRWGFSLAWEPPARGAVAVPEPARGLRDPLSWHTGLRFDDLSDSWTVIYSLGGRAVVAARDWDAGSIVLCADSYLFSNEALRDEPRPEVLAWLVGETRSVVFDEAHLGVLEQPSVASLLRRYDLEGVLGALALFVGLLVWKNANPLAPTLPESPRGSGRATTGRDSTAGFVNLLRRNIPASEILGVCFREWKRTITPTDLDDERWNRAAAVVEEQNGLASKRRDAVTAYRRISKAVSKSVFDKS